MQLFINSLIELHKCGAKADGLLAARQKDYRFIIYEYRILFKIILLKMNAVHHVRHKCQLFLILNRFCKDIVVFRHICLVVQ